MNESFVVLNSLIQMKFCESQRWTITASHGLVPFAIVFTTCVSQYIMRIRVIIQSRWHPTKSIISARPYSHFVPITHFAKLDPYTSPSFRQYTAFLPFCRLYKPLFDSLPRFNFNIVNIAYVVVDRVDYLLSVSRSVCISSILHCLGNSINLDARKGAPTNNHMATTDRKNSVTPIE